MKKLNTIGLLLLTSALLTGVALASNRNNSSNDVQTGYKMVLLNQCQVVHEQSMTAAQIEAYQALKVQEDIVHKVEQPIKAIEMQMHEYTDKIEKLTTKISQQTEGGVDIGRMDIDNKLFSQQESVAREFEYFMAVHKVEFDALSQQGHEISKVAKVFENLITADLGNIEHDQIHILTPQKQDPSYHCYADAAKR